MATAATSAAIGMTQRRMRGGSSTVVTVRRKYVRMPFGGTNQWPVPVGECSTVPASSDAVGSTPGPNEP